MRFALIGVLFSLAQGVTAQTQVNQSARTSKPPQSEVECKAKGGVWGSREMFPDVPLGYIHYATGYSGICATGQGR